MRRFDRWSLVWGFVRVASSNPYSSARIVLLLSAEMLRVVSLLQRLECTVSPSSVSTYTRVHMHTRMYKWIYMHAYTREHCQLTALHGSAGSYGSCLAYAQLMIQRLRERHADFWASFTQLPLSINRRHLGTLTSCVSSTCRDHCSILKLCFPVLVWEGLAGRKLG